MSNGSSENWYDKYRTGEEESPQSQPTQIQQTQLQPQVGENWYDKYRQPVVENTEEDEEEEEEKDTLIERTLGKNALTDFLGDLYRAGVSGVAAGETTGESFDMFQEAGDKELTDESIQKYIGAVEYAKNQDVTNEMKDFQRIYEEEGESLAGFFKGVKANPSILPQMLVSSFGTLGGSFFDSEEVAGFTALGAAAGSQIPIIGTAIGGFTGLTTAMETGLTISELVKDELDGKEFNKENVRSILEDEKKFNKMKLRALARGAAIGAFETVSLGLSRGVGAKILTKSTAGPLAKSLQISGATTAIEAIGGFTGEVAGQAAAGQEIDLGEATLEGIGEAKTAGN